MCGWASSTAGMAATPRSEVRGGISEGVFFISCRRLDRSTQARLVSTFRVPPPHHDRAGPCFKSAFSNFDCDGIDLPGGEEKAALVFVAATRRSGGRGDGARLDVVSLGY